MKNKATSFGAFSAYLRAVRALAQLDVDYIIKNNSEGLDSFFDKRAKHVTYMHKAISVLLRQGIKCPAYNNDISQDISDILANRI